MSNFSDRLFSAIAADKAQGESLWAQLKKGRTDEQMRIVDFFLGPRPGGCLSSGVRSFMTMDDYLNLVQRKCDAIDTRQMAIEKIGLDESQIQEIDPLVLSSFDYDVPSYLIKTTNTMAVSSKYSISWIFFSASQLYTYTYNFDMIKDETHEETNDFFYTDITCLSTNHYVKEKIITEKSGCFGSESISKYSYQVDDFLITVPQRSFSFEMINSSDMERSIQAAKAMLREKKYCI